MKICPVVASITIAVSHEMDGGVVLEVEACGASVVSGSVAKVGVTARLSTMYIVISKDSIFFNVIIPLVILKHIYT